MNRPRFLADHDLNEHIVTGIQRSHHHIEFIRVRDIGLADATDEQVLLYAARTGHCVVSHDVNTMPAAATAVMESGTTISGLFMVRQTTPVRVAIESLALVWSASEQDDWRNQIVFLPL
jgi:hypothetical protein